MKVVFFLDYYIKLRLLNWLGFHPTHRPLDIKWRWKYWNKKKKKPELAV